MEEKKDPVADEINDAGTQFAKLEALNEKQTKHLEHIEELLQQQLKQDVKIRRAQTARTVAVIILVIVVAVAGFYLYKTVKDATAGLPDLIAHADQLVKEASDDIADVVAKVNAIDFEGINSVIKGIDTINFDALNESIESLAQGVKNFQTFTDALANPFRLGS